MPSLGGESGRRRSTVARQIFLLQTAMVVVLVALASVLAYLDARETQLDGARDRAVAVAETVADTPTVRRAVRSSDPSRVLQPYAEQVRVDTGTDFVVVMALDRTRYSHPEPQRIGEPFIGDLGGAPRGEVFTQQYTGTLGPSMRAVVPVYDEGEVIALVSAGITLDRIEGQLRPRLAAIGVVALGVLLVGSLGTWLISRRLFRQTHGLGAAEITRMYEYYDAVLHAVREGLLLVDTTARVQLANDEAHRLLGLPPEEVRGAAVAELGLPAPLTETLLAPGDRSDEIHLVGDRVLVVNKAAARWAGREVGSVVTLRDHTELQAVTGELDTVRGLAESLRSQNHEAANRLHTVVSLIEMDRTDEALRFATDRLEAVQRLTDTVVTAVAEPVVAAVLLGKSAQASERGIDLRIAEDSEVRDLALDTGDVVTLLGNLIDNALDAAADSADRAVRVTVRHDGPDLLVRVEDSGPGVPPGASDEVFRRGWSTKPADGAVGRGLGLALVGQVVRRHGGSVSVESSELGGARFDVRIPHPGGPA